MSLLLRHLNTEARLQVRLALLRDLGLLAAADTAHLWTRDNVAAMVQFVRAEESEASVCRGVDILRDTVSLGCGGEDQAELVTSLTELCEQVDTSLRHYICTVSVYQFIKMHIKQEDHIFELNVKHF